METASQSGLFFQEFERLLKRRSQCVALYLLALFFAACCVLPFFESQGMLFVIGGSILLSIPFVFAVGALACVINILRSGTVETPLGFSVKCFLVPLVVIAVLWGCVAFLSCYPGICSEDTNDILKMLWGMPFQSDSFRYDSLNNHHPAFYVFLIWLAMRFGALLGLSQPMTIGLIALLHMLTLAACCSFVLSKLWLITKSRAFVAVTFAFFALNPLIMIYSVTIWKDVVFGGVFLVYVVEVFALLVAKKRFFSSRIDVVSLGASMLCCLLLRSNAFVVIVPMAIVLVVMVREAAKAIALLSAAAVIVAAVIVGPFYGALGIKPGHFAESVSIPLQQMAQVAASDDATISEAQREYLDELLPFEQYGEAYLPGHVNFIKFRSDFNDDALEKDKIRFFANWLDLGVQNPGLYTRAWIDQTKAFWDPAYRTWYTYEPGYNVDGNGPIRHDLTNGVVGYEKLAALFDALWSAATPLYTSAWLAWFALFALVIGLFRQPKSPCLCLLPLVFWWLSFLVAAPADDFRYMFPVHLALPLVALVLLYVPAAPGCTGER